jgi:hypothetical protein
MCTTEFKAAYNDLPSNKKALVRRSFLSKFEMGNRSTFYRKINGNRPLNQYERSFLLTAIS